MADPILTPHSGGDRRLDATGLLGRIRRIYQSSPGPMKIAAAALCAALFFHYQGCRKSGHLSDVLKLTEAEAKAGVTLNNFKENLSNLQIAGTATSLKDWLNSFAPKEKIRLTAAIQAILGRDQIIPEDQMNAQFESVTILGEQISTKNLASIVIKQILNGSLGRHNGHYYDFGQKINPETANTIREALTVGLRIVLTEIAGTMTQQDPSLSGAVLAIVNRI